MNVSNSRKFTIKCRSDLERRATGICVIACAVIVGVFLVHLAAWWLA